MTNRAEPALRKYKSREKVDNNPKPKNINKFATWRWGPRLLLFNSCIHKDFLCLIVVFIKRKCSNWSAMKIGCAAMRAPRSGVISWLVLWHEQQKPWWVITWAGGRCFLTIFRSFYLTFLGSVFGILFIVVNVINCCHHSYCALFQWLEWQCTMY